MSRINEKLGLKPNSRIRIATHSRFIVPGGKCPNCPGRHVIEAIPGRRLCYFCGHGWDAKDDAVEESSGFSRVGR
jgi:hypothetical protein